MTAPTPFGLLLSDDLIFASRITGVGRDLGRVVRQARTIDGLFQVASQQRPGCVIVDLAFPGLVVPELLGRLRDTCQSVPHVVAYGSHVDAAGLKAARDAGCDLVLPRSKFVEDLPLRLVEWLDATPG